MAYLARFSWIALAVAGGTWGRHWQDLRLMAAVDGDHTSFAPSVYFQSLSASAIGMAVFLKILRSADIEKTKHEFIKRLTQRFAKEDIKLA